MKPWGLLVILVFCLVVRGFASAILSSYFDPYYLDLGAQTAMNLGIIALCLQEFQLTRRDVKAIVGMFTWAGVLGAAGLALVVLMFTFGESAVSTLILAHFNPKWVYRLGNFHSQALPSHPFFSFTFYPFLSRFRYFQRLLRNFSSEVCYFLPSYKITPA